MKSIRINANNFCFLFLYLYNVFIFIHMYIKQKQKKKEKKYIKMMKSEKHFIYIKNKISIYFINIGKY